MRIAFVLSSCANLGPFIVAQNIINNIYDKANHIDVFYLKESSEKLEFRANTVKVNLLKVTNFSNYDIVHSHGFLGDVYAYLCRKTINGKWITTIHQDIKPDYALKYNLLISSILEVIWCHFVSKSDCIITLSKQMAKYYEQVITKTPITYIYNGVSPKINYKIDSSEVLMLSQLKLKYTTLGISANLIYRKGIDKAIESLTLPDADKLSLIIIGDGEKKGELIRLSEKLKVEDRVLFLGYKSNSIDYFRYFDLYLMCSRSEGFGLCVIEAASQRIPVICNDLPIYKELFSDEVVRFQLDNLESLVSAANIALKHRDILSDSIYTKYTSSFSSEAMAQKYFDLYCKPD
jgi:L-malate glycosyltransferase